MTFVKRRHLKKIDNLFNKTHDCNELNSKPSVDKSRWVMNLSGNVLSEQENSLLSKGMNFSITPKIVPMKEIISKVEGSLKTLNKVEGDTIRAKVSLTLQKAKLPKDNLSQAERASLKNLKDDVAIIILPTIKAVKQSFLTKKTT